MPDGAPYREPAEDRFTIERRRIAILRYKQVFSIGNMMRAVLLALLQRVRSAPRRKNIEILTPAPRWGVRCPVCQTEISYTVKALRAYASGSYVCCPGCKALMRHDPTRIYNESKEPR
jgi:hypothetical protein